MKSIYTYMDPFKMKDDRIIRDCFYEYPQFCASDTLVQGLIECYGRESFYIIQTVNDLQRALVGKITDNAAFDMQLFLDVSHEVRKCGDTCMVSSFKNNMSEVVKSIKWLLLLECDTTCFFEIEKLLPEQVQLIDIYKRLKSKYHKEIYRNIQLNKENVYSAIRQTVLKEAEYLIKRNMEDSQVADYSCKTVDDAMDKMLVIERELTESLKSRDDYDFSKSREIEVSLRRIKYLETLINKIIDKRFDKIVIHGVHKFTPELLLLIRVIEKVGIDIVFLINYADGLSAVYDTWKRVYEWTGCEFENVCKLDFAKGKKLGRDVANIYSGNIVSYHLDDERLEYENLSSFATDEVKSEFTRSGENLGKMKIQYYAVDNSDTNEILKHYFPDQFECKPFLSYPIGQFILGIYKMWDFDSDVMKIQESALRECVAAGIYVSKSSKSLVEIFERAWSYFGMTEDIELIYGKFIELKSNIEVVERNKNLSMLKHISYYSLTLEEIGILEDFVHYLHNLAMKIFAHDSEVEKFDEHFRNMISILSEQASDAIVINQVEKELVAQVWKALEEHGDNSIVGDFSDVREALAFYLSQNSIDDSSNWIVRNFEQIDGAVLLSKKTHAKKYHFSLLSMRNMARTSKDVLPWPLTEEMFNQYAEDTLKTSMYACGVSVRERANFLRYSLFYGTFFSQRPITLSYVKSQNGEEQRPYYLLNLLDLVDGKCDKSHEIILPDLEETKGQDVEKFLQKCGEEEREFFEVCNYKFFLNVVASEPVIYKNDYHVKYFVTNSLCALLLEDKIIDKDNYERRVEKYIQYFRGLFPMYDDVAFNDIKRKVTKETYKSLDYREKNPGRGNPVQYNRRKRNFLLARWYDPETNEEFMNFNRPVDTVKTEIKEYMCKDVLITVMPHEVICENCSNNAKCLLSYYSRLREGTE